MKYIYSDKNPQVKQWKKLLSRKEREKSGLFMVEGFHLVEEAIKSSSEVHDIILSEKTELPSHFDYGDTPITVVNQEIANSLTETETTQGIFAVCSQPENNHVNGKNYLLIDAVQDPGNLGTMIRTADAAGIDAVIVGKGSVDIYNPKVLRSAQGSHFHLPILTGHLSEWIHTLNEKNIPVFGTALENGEDYRKTGSQDSFALLVGNEGNGVNEELLSATTKNLFIPIFGNSESLNVAVATGILLYALKAGN